MSQSGSLQPAAAPRLAVLLPDLLGGGAQRAVVTLANGFAARGAAVDLLLARAIGEYFHEVDPSVRIVHLGARRAAVTAILPLAKYLERERPDALLSTLAFTNVGAVMARWLASHRPWLVLREAASLTGVGEAAESWKYRITPLCIRMAYRYADRVVGVSEGVSRELIEKGGVPQEHVVTIYNPVVTSNLDRLAEEPVDHPWFAAGGPRIILAVGRLKPQKDFHTLLRAFHLVRRRVDCRLMILGEGDQRQELTHLAEELGHREEIAMPGFVQNPFRFMRRSDVFVLSSRFEGLPNALIQAMATGCPVVSTDCPHGPKEILKSGKWGKLVPVGDVQAMARAIEAVLEGRFTPRNPRPRAADFSADRAVNAYWNVLTRHP